MKLAGLAKGILEMGANIKKDESSPIVMEPDFTRFPPMYRMPRIVRFPSKPVYTLLAKTHSKGS